MPDLELEAAWSAVHDALPTGWSVMRPLHHGEEHERPWHVWAMDLRSAARRGDRVEATGQTEAEALQDLADLLREWRIEEAPSSSAWTVS